MRRKQATCVSARPKEYARQRLVNALPKRKLYEIVLLVLTYALLSSAVSAQVDPGPRGGAAGAGGQISGLTTKEAKFFDSGLDSFTEVSSVTGSGPGTEAGLGPRFNMTSCANCHAHPAIGGTSPSVNPQVNQQVNPVPASQIDPLVTLGIIHLSGPVREVRFSTDGG